MYRPFDHERSAAGTRALWAIAIVLIASVAVALALPQTMPRRFPDRKPIHVWHPWTAEWKTIVDRIVATYNASQDRYEVIALSVPAHTAASKFLSSVAGGAPPDVIVSWDAVIPKWAEGGIIMPLDGLMSAEERERVTRSAYPISLKIGTYKSRLYAIVTGLDVYACYLRTDFAREAGLDAERPPETLDNLVAWGEKLDRFDSNKRLVRAGFLDPLSSVLGLAMFAPAFGGGFYDWDRGVLTLNTPENLRALSFLAGTRERLGFENVVRFESGHSGDVANAAWPFITGAYGITIDGQWRVEQIAQYAPDLAYDTFPIPPPVGGRAHAGWASGNFAMIAKGAKNVEGAWEFIRFWSGIDNPDRAAEFYTWGGWLPPFPDLAEAPAYREYVEKNPRFKAFLDVLPSEYLQPMPPVSHQAYLWDRIAAAYAAAMRGTLRPDAALARITLENEREVAMHKELGYTE